MGTIDCLETSEANYRSTLRNIPEEGEISCTTQRKPEITIILFDIVFQRNARVTPSCA